MARYAYLNGSYVYERDAAVHIEDRGHQFGDGVYEGITIVNGKLLDFEPHLARLDRSLSELRIKKPFSTQIFRMNARELIRRNRIQDGFLYLQVTRGTSPRDHPFPPDNVLPSILMTAKRLNFDAIQKRQESGIKVITTPDQRWARVDVKSINLLGNVMAKQKARENGAFEAWMVDAQGFVTEGTSTNAWIITKDGQLITRHLSQAILPGITRKAMMRVAEDEGLSVEERPFTVDEAKKASEAFITSSTCFVSPIVEIDDTKIGTGKPGPIGKTLVKSYWDYARKTSD
jgi:D-alanine transaminase